MLDESFRKRLKQYIQEFVDYSDLMNHFATYREQTIIKYENAYDFWYGYMVGHCQGYVLALFENTYGRTSSDEELQEIREAIEVEYTHMRNKLERFKPRE